MAENLSMALAELLRKADAEPDVDTLREGVRVMTQALMELEVAQHLGAERYQRSPDRQVNATGTAIGTGIREWAHSSCGYPAFVMAASFRACSSHASERSAPWWRPCARPTCRA